MTHQALEIDSPKLQIIIQDCVISPCIYYISLFENAQLETSAGLFLFDFCLIHNLSTTIMKIVAVERLIVLWPYGL